MNNKNPINQKTGFSARAYGTSILYTTLSYNLFLSLK